MLVNKKREWIDEGYRAFADEGPNGLIIEVISRKINKSKSSFYHHFVDLEGFTESLLEYHIEKSKVITKVIQSSNNMVPDILNLFLSIKQDILFNRQLRIHRHIPIFKECLEQSHQPVENALLNIWANELGLSNKNLARIMLNLVVENFYLCVTAETFNSEWLLNYLEGIHIMIREINKNKN